jgi:hypothetical protein
LNHPREGHSIAIKLYRDREERKKERKKEKKRERERERVE